MMALLLELYGKMVADRPLLTQICTAGFMVTSGDFISQQAIERKKFHDFRRTVVMAICGFLYIGPSVTLWLMFLDSMELQTFVNVILDQFVVSPPLLGGFIIIHSLLNGQGMSTIKHRFVHEFPDILKTNWMVWIPVQFLNFQLIPVQFRMLFNQVVSLFWNCYLSSKTAGNTNQEPEKKKTS